IEAQAVADRELDAAVLDDLEDGPGVLDGGSDRLLEEDVLTGGSYFAHGFEVQRVGRGDYRHVDICSCEEFRDRGVGFTADAGSHLRGPAGGDVDDGGKTHRWGLQHRVYVCGADRAETDDCIVAVH